MKSAAGVRFALIAALCLLSTLLHYAQPQAAPPKPADPPAKIAMPSGPAKEALLLAIHKQDQAAKEVSDLNQKVQTLQMQIQTESTRLQSKQSDANKAVDAARAAAFKAANLDEARYSLDYETWEFTAKPETKAVVSPPATTAPPAPAPGRQPEAK